MSGNIDLMLGMAFILFYSSRRFNTPATNRSSTTAARYYVALLLYCLAGLSFYFLFVHSPHLLTFLLQGDNAAIPDWAQKLTTPLLVTLLLTVLLPKLPILSQIDDWILNELQYMASIPHEVRRLSAELRKAEFDVTAEERDLLQEELAKAGVQAEDVLFSPKDSPAKTWTRLGVLLVKLEDWRSDRKMVRYLEDAPGQLDQLRKRYNQLLPKAKTCLRLLKEDAASGATDRTHEAVASYQQDFMEQVTEIYHELLDFISRGILHSELTDAARLTRLATLGFSVRWSGERFTLNQTLSLFAVVCILMLSSLVFLAPRNGNQPFGVLLTRAIMISVIYSVAVACVVMPRAKWKFAAHRPGQFPPVLFYLVASLMAVGISAGISLAFNCLLERGFDAGLRRYLLTYPWLLLTFATALTTGFLLDFPTLPNIPQRYQRWMEGLIQGLVLLGFGYLAHFWLMQRIGMASTIPPNYRVPSLGWVMSISAAVGFVIGFCVPTWHRVAPSHSDVAPEQDMASLNLGLNV